MATPPLSPRLTPLPSPSPSLGEIRSAPTISPTDSIESYADFQRFITSPPASYLNKSRSYASLILQLAAQPFPKILELLLTQGESPETANPFKQTLLHIAAQAGEEENVKVLLQKGARIDSQDLSQRTPLFLAVLQGHRSVVQLFLEKGARVDLSSIEGETLLHTAAFYGHTSLLQDLLARPSCKNLISALDQDGKTPLHKAVWGDPKPEAVELLLAHGADPNARNKYNYTPLHWAAKHGHVKSAEILLKCGADPNAVNDNQDLPLDLALRHGQDEIVHLFLGTAQRLKIDGPAPQDPLKYYQDCLMKARQAHLIEEQLFYLEKISDHSLKQKNFILGAMILNAAIAFLKAHKNHPFFEQYLLLRIERVEGIWLETQGIKIPPADNKKFRPAHNRTDLRRQELQAIRKQAASSFQARGFSPDILQQLTADFRSLLSHLLLDAQALLGPPPVDWSCLGLGSMARGEMSPFSDLEFAFLIEEETPEALDYFRKLARLLQIQVINLGETKCAVFGPFEASPTPNGFCMDTGGNVPLGGVFELIGTPKTLAQLQTSRWIHRNIILSNAMSATCLVAGNTKLVGQYFKERSEVQKRKEAEGSTQASSGLFHSLLQVPATLLNNLSWWIPGKSPIENREKLALRLLAGHLEEFSPKLTKEKEQLRVFGIKKELYRPFQEIISSLALFYKLTSTNTFDRIEELSQLKIFCPQGAAHLKKALSEVLSLRLQAHLFYQDETEFLHHLEEGAPLDPKKLYLTAERIKTLQEIYQVLIPFCKAAEQFYHSQEKQAFFTQEFYDDRLFVQAQALEKALQYKAALAAYQQAASINPDDGGVLLYLGKMENDVGDAQEGLERANQALRIAREKYGENHPTVAASLVVMGGILNSLGKWEEALERHGQVLQILKAFYGENHSFVAATLNQMGLVLNNLEKADEALARHTQALKIQQTLYGENHPHVAGSLHCMGVSLYILGKVDEALELHRRALKIYRLIYGENHPDIAMTLNHIGLALGNLGKAAEALEQHNQALQMQRILYGENHREVAASLSNIGVHLCSLGKAEEAVDHHRRALHIQRACCGEQHPDVAASLDNMGSVLYDLGKIGESLELYSQAFKIRQVFYGENHPSVARSLNNMGTVLLTLGKTDEALKLFSRALQIQRTWFGENHRNVATSLSNMGSALSSLGKANEALALHSQALKIQQRLYGENHPNVAQSLNNMGTVLHELGRLAEALDHHNRSLQMQRALYGKKHPDIAISLSNIGSVLLSQGKADKALKFYRQALQMQRELYGKRHPHVAISLNSIGSALNSLGKADKALDYHKRALQMQRAIYGENHPSLANCLNRMGGALSNLGKVDEALEHYKQAVQILRALYGDNHPGIAVNLNNIGIALYRLGKMDEALNHHNRAFQIQQAIYGENHPSMAVTLKCIQDVYFSLAHPEKNSVGI